MCFSMIALQVISGCSFFPLEGHNLALADADLVLLNSNSASVMLSNERVIAHNPPTQCSAPQRLSERAAVKLITEQQSKSIEYVPNRREIACKNLLLS